MNVAILDIQRISPEVQEAIAKIAAVAIFPILRMCSGSIHSKPGVAGANEIGFITGLAFHHQDDAELDTTELLHGLGRAYGERLRGENASDAETAIKHFAAGLQLGFGQPVTTRPRTQEVAS